MKRDDSIARARKAVILRIPELRQQGLTNKEIAAKLGMAERTLLYWVGRLRKEGYELPKTKPKGRPPLNLKP